MKPPAAFLLIVLLAGLASPAFAIPPPAAPAKAKAAAPVPEAKKTPNNPCTVKDLAGAWVMVYFQEKPPGWETEQFKRLPYEYVAFDGGGALTYLHANNPITKASVLESHMQDKIGYTYRLGKNGLVQFLLNQKPFRTSWCQVIQKTRGGYQQGDLIMNKSDANSSATFVYRKIPLPQVPNATR